MTAELEYDDLDQRTQELVDAVTNAQIGVLICDEDALDLLERLGMERGYAKDLLESNRVAAMEACD